MSAQVRQRFNEPRLMGFTRRGSLGRLGCGDENGTAAEYQRFPIWNGFWVCWLSIRAVTPTAPNPQRPQLPARAGAVSIAAFTQKLMAAAGLQTHIKIVPGRPRHVPARRPQLPQSPELGPFWLCEVQNGAAAWYWPIMQTHSLSSQRTHFVVTSDQARSNFAPNSVANKKTNRDGLSPRTWLM
jgi:hypothetical protein